MMSQVEINLSNVRDINIYWDLKAQNLPRKSASKHFKHFLDDKACLSRIEDGEDLTFIKLQH